MEQIFTALKLDGTFFYQLIISGLFFVLIRFVLFDQLKVILCLRFDQTQGLEKKTEENHKSIETVSQKYKSMMDEAYSNAQKVIKETKNEELTRGAQEIQQAQDKGEEYIASQRKEAMDHIQGLRANIMSETQNLAKELAQKFVKS